MAPSLPEIHGLPPGEAHVWLARPEAVQDAGQIAGLRALLDPRELDRHARGRSESLRRLFLVSHALVRCALSRYADVPPEAWRFAEGEHGRPEVASPSLASALRFNLSHTQGLAACVVTREIDCGLDVERVGRVKDLSGMARRVFCEAEREGLEALPETERARRFTEIWALKEAYVKARGMGFQLPLREIGMRIRPQGGVGITFSPGFEDDPDDWQLALSTPAEGEHEGEFRLGVALRRGRSPDWHIRVREGLPLSL